MTPFFANSRNLAIIGVVVVIALIVGITMLIGNPSMNDLTAQPGDHVYVHYVGTFENGQKFDSSLDAGQPIDFILGAGQVIKGWDDGIQGMKKGDKKKLIIPPALGYGSQDVTDAQGNVIIPANSTLVFDVELVKIER